MKHTAASAARIARRVLHAGDAVLEIGAADGEHTAVYADRVGPTGCVVAVEPHRQHAQALGRLCATRPWVLVQQLAVESHEGTREFYPDRGNAKCGSLWAANVLDTEASYPVPVTTIDALVDAMPRPPRLIQVDAQGAEAAIVLGAARTLQSPIVWVIELWAAGLLAAGGSVDDVLSAFMRSGYVPVSLRGSALEWQDVRDYTTDRPWAGHFDVVMRPAHVSTEMDS